MSAISSSEQHRQKMIRQAGELKRLISPGYAIQTDGTVTNTIPADSSTFKGVSNWKHLVGIVSGFQIVFGIHENGTVSVLGENTYKQWNRQTYEDDILCTRRCDVKEWQNIVSIASGMFHTIGLKSDGSLVGTGIHHGLPLEDDRVIAGSVGSAWNAGLWFWQYNTKVTAIAAGCCHTVALTENSLVYAEGDNTYGQCDVLGKEWQNVIAVAAGYAHTVGLRADGTVVATGKNTDLETRYCGQCEVSQWRDVVDIACGDIFTIGLTVHGTVLFAGRHHTPQIDPGSWNDIVAISAVGDTAYGLRSDGTVVQACALTIKNAIIGRIARVRLFQSIDTLEEERTEGARKARLQEKEALYRRTVSALEGIAHLDYPTKAGRPNTDLEAWIVNIRQVLSEIQSSIDGVSKHRRTFEQLGDYQAACAKVEECDRMLAKLRQDDRSVRRLLEEKENEKEELDEQKRRVEERQQRRHHAKCTLFHLLFGALLIVSLVVYFMITPAVLEKVEATPLWIFIFFVAIPGSSALCMYFSPKYQNSDNKIPIWTIPLAIWIILFSISQYQ